jgi:uncharacterized glyoxalase superfamily protein PhnB
MTRSAVPRLIVDDPDEAIEFYRQGLGARPVERYVMDEVVVHAALAVGDASFTLAAEVRDWGLLSPRSVGGASSLVTLDVLDAPAVAAAMVAAGAEIVVPVIDRPYGRCEGRVRDPFGHLWIPSHPLNAPALPMVRRIVADLTAEDLSSTAEFYVEVFGLDVVMDAGWVVTLAAPGRSTTQVTLVTGDATAQVNAVVSVEVDDLDVVYQRVLDRGAEVVHERRVEAWGVERFFVRDPAGHVINVLCHRPGNG